MASDTNSNTGFIFDVVGFVYCIYGEQIAIVSLNRHIFFGNCELFTRSVWCEQFSYIVHFIQQITAMFNEEPFSAMNTRFSPIRWSVHLLCICGASIAIRYKILFDYLLFGFVWSLVLLDEIRLVCRTFSASA